MHFCVFSLLFSEHSTPRTLYYFCSAFFCPENAIDISVFQDLDEDAIKELIPKIGTRLKFLKGWRMEVILTCVLSV